MEDDNITLDNIKQKDGKKELFATLYCVTCIEGYCLTQSLLSPIQNIVEDSSYMSWGYHIVTVIYAALIIFVFKKEKVVIYRDYYYVIIFFLMYVMRMIYDLEFVGENLSPLYAYKLESFDFSYLRMQTYVYVFALTIFKIIALVKCIEYIDFKKLLLYIYVFGLIGCAVSFYSTRSLFESSQEDELNRLVGNITLTEVYFANYIGLIIVVAMFLWQNVKKFKWIILMSIIMLFNLELLTGSRGPILSSTISLLFFIFFYKPKLLLLLAFAILFVFVIPDLFSSIEKTFTNNYLTFFSRISRDNRTMVYQMFYDELKRNLLFGYQLDFLGYSHNVVLDSFMMFGMFGGLIIPLTIIRIVSFFISCYKKFSIYYCIVFMSFYLTICQMFSFSVGTNLEFWSCFILSIYLYNTKKELFTTNHSLSVQETDREQLELNRVIVS